MKLYAIGDLHLPGNSDKPMDVFGPAWCDHPTRIADAWRGSVTDEDIVLVPGDISWAMRLEDARDDIQWLQAMPGTKVFIKGNHDYWWNSITKVRALLGERCFALQNDALAIGEYAIAGSRGWSCPGSSGYTESEDGTIYRRELIRFELSLKQASCTGKKIVAMLHFPPFNEHRTSSGFTELMECYHVSQLVYGHLHGKACSGAFEGERAGIRYNLVSADHIAFAPKYITGE